MLFCFHYILPCYVIADSSNSPVISLKPPLLTDPRGMFFVFHYFLFLSFFYSFPFILSFTPSFTPLHSVIFVFISAFLLSQHRYPFNSMSVSHEKCIFQKVRGSSSFIFTLSVFSSKHIPFLFFQSQSFQRHDDDHRHHRRHERREENDDS